MVERGHDDGVRGEKGHTHLLSFTGVFAGLHSSNGLCQYDSFLYQMFVQ